MAGGCEWEVLQRLIREKRPLDPRFFGNEVEEAGGVWAERAAAFVSLLGEGTVLDENLDWGVDRRFGIVRDVAAILRRGRG